MFSTILIVPFTIKYEATLFTGSKLYFLQVFLWHLSLTGTIILKQLFNSVSVNVVDIYSICLHTSHVSKYPPCTHLNFNEQP